MIRSAIVTAAVVALGALTPGMASAAPDGAGFSECAKLAQEAKRLCKDGAPNAVPTYSITDTVTLMLGDNIRNFKCDEGDSAISFAYGNIRNGKDVPQDPALVTQYADPAPLFEDLTFYLNSAYNGGLLVDVTIVCEDRDPVRVA